MLSLDSTWEETREAISSSKSMRGTCEDSQRRRRRTITSCSGLEGRQPMLRLRRRSRSLRLSTIQTRIRMMSPHYRSIKRSRLPMMCSAMLTRGENTIDAGKNASMSQNVVEVAVHLVICSETFLASGKHNLLTRFKFVW